MIRRIASSTCDRLVRAPWADFRVPSVRLIRYARRAVTAATSKTASAPSVISRTPASTWVLSLPGRGLLGFIRVSRTWQGQLLRRVLSHRCAPLPSRLSDHVTANNVRNCV